MSDKARFAIMTAMGTVLLALGLWSGVGLTRALVTDPSSGWGNYLILIFPALFLVLAGGLFHQAATRKIHVWPRPASKRLLFIGPVVTILAVLRQTTARGAVIAAIAGMIATGIWMLVSRAFEADRRERDARGE
ncbi:MAG TPA: hypothetical protein VMU31_02160 [Rhizomicrobium sp.]|nr:hypothetical protein [Rhizomicrobium sp.]